MVWASHFFNLLKLSTVQVHVSEPSYCSFHINLSNAFWQSFFYYFLFLDITYMICVKVLMFSEMKFQLDP